MGKQNNHPKKAAKAKRTLLQRLFGKNYEEHITTKDVDAVAGIFKHEENKTTYVKHRAHAQTSRRQD